MPPVQPLDLRDDRCLRRHPPRLVGRQSARRFASRAEPHGDVEPVEDRRSGDAGIGENAAKTGTTVGERGHRGVLGSADGVKAPADQHLDVRIGVDDGAENLPATGRRFDIADANLKMPLAVRAARG